MIELLNEPNETCPAAEQENPADLSHWREQMARITAACQLAARGDLEARITGCDPEGQIGDLCRAINDMLDRADSFVREAAAAAEDFARDRFHRPILLQGLKGAYRNSGCIINQAGLKMHVSHTQAQATARLASETAANVATVAAACEELHATNREISRQASDAAAQTQRAVQQASQAGTVAKEMTSATLKIENMAAFINRIAAQTNLLALNATIEAARAGESGRGFAVVAGEVKELARSSATTVENIEVQIALLRTTVQSVVKLIEGVNETIRTIDQNAGHIDRVAKEQSQATDEIARNVSEVAQKTREISSSMEKVQSTDGAAAK